MKGFLRDRANCRESVPRVCVWGLACHLSLAVSLSLSFCFFLPRGKFFVLLYSASPQDHHNGARWSWTEASANTSQINLSSFKVVFFFFFQVFCHVTERWITHPECITKTMKKEGMEESPTLEIEDGKIWQTFISTRTFWLEFIVLRRGCDTNKAWYFLFQKCLINITPILTTRSWKNWKPATLLDSPRNGRLQRKHHHEIWRASESQEWQLTFTWAEQKLLDSPTDKNTSYNVDVMEAECELM